MKNRISFFLGLSLLLFLISASAHAQPKQTWVSAAGVDENPDPDLFNCPRIAPCKTFAGAIARTAPGGEISVLDSGDFGSVVITKPITINGGSMFAGILAEFSNGVIVNVTGPGDSGVVILRGLSINGGGTGLNGIRYLAGGKLIVEHCSIYGFTQNDILVSPLAAPGNLAVNDTTLTGDVGGSVNGIDVVNATSLHVENSIIDGFSQSGLLVENSATGIGTFVKDTVMRNNGGNVIAAGKAVFENCRFEKSTIGFQVSQGAKTTLNNCVIAGNLLFGLYCHDATGSQAMVDGCQISNNLIGIQSEDSGQVRVSNSNITNNTTGLSTVRAGTILSRISLFVLTNTLQDNGVNGAFTGFYQAK
ncbi:MAG: right-handed parallel beta-helix repeat-containing protein [Pyrinomonadaceae bacterium]